MDTRLASIIAAVNVAIVGAMFLFLALKDGFKTKFDGVFLWFAVNCIYLSLYVLL